jgi:Uma2 family endonuclease
MSYPLLQPRRISVEEFRAMEAQAPAGERWELINGVIVKAQAGTTVRHNDIVQNVASVIRAELRRLGSKCRTSTENIRLDIENATTSVMPDVIVNCGERRGPSTTFRTACAVVEVISPSTSGDDKVWKLETYFTLPELRTVLLIEQTEMRVASHTRTSRGWIRVDLVNPEDAVMLDGLDVSITLAQIYDEIEFDA